MEQRNPSIWNGCRMANQRKVAAAVLRARLPQNLLRHRIAPPPAQMGPPRVEFFARPAWGTCFQAQALGHRHNLQRAFVAAKN